MRRLLLLVIISLTGLTLAQAQELLFSGIVTKNNGKPLPGVTISAMNNGKQVSTDEQGQFSISLPAAKYTFLFSHLGFEKYELAVDLKKSERRTISLAQHQGHHMDEVRVEAKTGIKKVKESAYNVTVLDAKPTYNTSMELTTLLNKASGVKIRQEAGLGSDYNISINGFTGKAVKVFMDGVPMDGFGSAYNLNNIPTTLIDRIEIYKGVVPIEFGGDALGGVINIISRKVSRSYVDASYSFGSFNTHKTNINVGYVADNGFTVDVRAIQNYSDNSYKVYSKSLNLATETFSETKSWYKRFNDTYHNESLIAKVGYVNTSWADQFFITGVVGNEYKEIQNAYQQQLVYGMRHTKGTSFMPSITYVKRNFLAKKLDVNVNGNYNRNYNQSIDTASRTYNWEGLYKTKKSVGEGASTRAKYYNHNGSVTGNIKYQLADHHNLNVNDNFTSFTRKSKNELQSYDQLSARDTMRTATNKNVLGLSYQYDSKKNWNASVFYKLYSQYVIGAVDTSSSSSTQKYAEKNRTTNNSGYGFMGTYFIDKIQLKLSYEKAFRLLSATELFGDENLETANSSLKPEKSNNINFNIAYNKNFNQQHDFYIEGGFIYRDTYDYIRKIVDQRAGTMSSFNFGRVRSMGVDAEAKYAYKNKLLVGASFTYLTTENQQKYVSAISTQQSLTYKDQLPNVPYIYGNMDVQYIIHKFLKPHNSLTVGYNLNYINEFYLGWPSLGSEKYTLPTQVSHDVFVTASFLKGKYNITLAGSNLSNELLYDNYELQKPGRSFNIKLRYFISKTHS